MPIRQAQDFWNLHSRTARNNEATEQMRIDNQTRMAQNLVKLLYQRNLAQQAQQNAIAKQRANQFNQATGADYYGRMAQLRENMNVINAPTTEDYRQKKSRTYENLKRRFKDVNGADLSTFDPANYPDDATGAGKMRSDITDYIKSIATPSKVSTSEVKMGKDIGVSGEGENDYFEVQRNPDGSIKSYETLSKNTLDDNAGGELTEQGIEYAAEQYNLTGQMPSLGRGKQAAISRAQIINKASELQAARGISATSAPMNRNIIKANQAALQQLTKQEQMVAAFEKNANLNADMALNLSNKVSKVGVPVLDAWILAGRKSVKGDPLVSQFNAANETFVNEYAKIMSGSMGNTAVSDAAREHAHDMLSIDMDTDQYAAVVGTLKQEMSNRMTGFEKQKEELKAAMNKAYLNLANPNKSKVYNVGRFQVEEVK